MTYKKSILLLRTIVPILILVACAPTATQSPTVDQDAVATIVAATQTALAEIPTGFPPTVQPTQPEPTQVEPGTSTAMPTIPASQTTEPIPAVRIAYIKDGNVYLWTEGYGSVGLTDSHDAVDLRISGDGELVAYVRQDPNDSFIQELWACNANGSPNPRVLVSSIELAALKPSDPNPFIGGIGILDFAWRQDTHELTYNTLILHEGPGFSPNHDVRLVNADTLAKTTLLDKGEGGLFYYSPDGNQNAISNPESISLINADGSNLRRDVLTFPAVITYSEYQYHPHPIWAADSSSLRVTIPPGDPLAEPLQATGLWRIPVDGSPAVLQGNIYAMPFAWPDHAFAPDLEHVIYAMLVGDPPENQRELHIANPDGSNDVLYDIGESLEFMQWSPDSQHFLYAINGGAREGVYWGTLDAQPELLKAGPQSMTDIQWLDRLRFAYLTSSGDQWELRVREVGGDDLAFIDTIPDSSPSYDVLP